MRSFVRLQTLFHTVTTLSLAVSACGGAVSGVPNTGDGGTPGPDGGIDPTGFNLNVCDAAAYHPLTGVTVSPRVDYLELRIEYGFSPQDGGPPQIQSVATEGTACMNASDPGGCNNRLASLRSSVGWLGDSGGGPPVADRRYVVYTRLDEVGAVTSLDALAQFLSPATLKSAALLASEQGHRFDCARPNARATTTGFDFITETGQTCGPGTGIDQNLVSVSFAGALAVVEKVRIQDGDPRCAVGRRPEGFQPTRSASGSSLGAYFAEMAELEAASVYAFDRLVQELRAHGAPDDLVVRARDAGEDEVRHTRAAQNLAERFGAEHRAPDVEARGVRGLYEIALENAAEGCVRETFGALSATYQSKHANDRTIARAMKAIAEDETRHAALAWDVAVWIEPLLTSDERARIDRARRDAVEMLARDLETSIDRDVVRRAGVPDAHAAAWLLDQVRGELWAA